MSAEPRAVWKTARIVEATPVTDQVRRITLERAPTRRAAPGTHVDVRVPIGSATDVRSYSVVESNADGSLLTISVRRADPTRGGSAYLHTVGVGAELPCTQPLQNFELRHGAARYVLLAGGIGITALIETSRVLRRLGLDYLLVYVGRSRDEMAYLDDLVAEHDTRIRAHVDDQGTSLDVTALVREIADSAIEGRTELYQCGPIRLMDAVRRAWGAAGLAPADLRFETFGNSGWFDPEPFTVDVPELGISTTVDKSASLLEALAAIGADIMYDCRKGECGLCEMRVGDVAGRVDHRDVFLSDEEKSSDETVCVCVSRVVAPDGAIPGSGRISLRL